MQKRVSDCIQRRPPQGFHFQQMTEKKEALSVRFFEAGGFSYFLQLQTIKVKPLPLRPEKDSTVSECLSDRELRHFHLPVIEDSRTNS
jgi:hypothetical protein